MICTLTINTLCRIQGDCDDWWFNTLANWPPFYKQFSWTWFTMRISHRGTCIAFGKILKATNTNAAISMLQTVGIDSLDVDPHGDYFMTSDRGIFTKYTPIQSRFVHQVSRSKLPILWEDSLIMNLIEISRIVDIVLKTLRYHWVSKQAGIVFYKDNLSSLGNFPDEK